MWLNPISCVTRYYTASDESFFTFHLGATSYILLHLDCDNRKNHYELVNIVMLIGLSMYHVKLSCYIKIILFNGDCYISEYETVNFVIIL